MKTVLVIFGLLIAIRSSSLAAQVVSAELTTSNASAVVQLVDKKFEPIYAQEPYETTCSREVLDHTETQCSTYDDTVCSGGGTVCVTENDSVCNSQGCTTVPRRSCHTEPQSCTTVPRTSCTDRPVYRTEYYSCTQYRTIVVGQKLVKTFNHTIEVALADSQIAVSGALKVEVVAIEGNTQARLVGSYASNILNYQVSDVAVDDRGDVMNINRRVLITKGIEGASALKILSAQIQNLALGSSAVRFDFTQAGSLAKALKMKIKIVRNRRIGRDSVLAEQIISTSSLSLVSQGETLKVLVPLEKIGLSSLSSNRHDVEVSVSLDVGQVLNASEFQAALNKSISEQLTGVKPSF